MEEIQKFEALLREIGLTNYESKIYLALLDIGKSTSGEILKKAEIRTGKIYEILESLKNKGFVSEIIENNIKKFSPTDPNRIDIYLKKKKEIISNYEKSLKNFLPSIMEKINKDKNPIKIEIFTGDEGYKTASYKEINRYKKGSKLYVLGVLPEEKYSKIAHSHYMENVQPRRLLKKVEVKKIFTEEAKGETKYIEKGTQVRYIPYNSPITINIIDDLTILEIFSIEIIMISIESKEIAESFIDQFNLLWKIAKK
ncbi:MAG: helix-turn-helix domain-containing protein [Nanoarchaeota archaeon]